MVHREIDRTCNGEISSCEDWTYDVSGHLLAQGTDEYCDGQLDHDCIAWTFDDQGRQLSKCTGCGVNPNECDRCEYNPDGSSACSNNRDDTGDGTPNYCIHSTYSPTGLKLSEGYDPDCDGVLDTYCFTWTYDENGEMVTEIRDENCDGIGEKCWQTAFQDVIVFPSLVGNTCYDSFEILHDVRVSLNDVGCDQTIDSCVLGAVISDGTWDEVMNTCRGEIGDFCWLFSISTDGHVLDFSTDDTCDGVPDQGCSHVVYNNDGNVLSAQCDMDCNGTTDCNSELTSYDTQGRILTSSSDDNCDGRSTSCRAYTYSTDAEQNTTTRWEEDQDCDGIPNNCMEVTYDADGNDIIRHYDDLCDGAGRCFMQKTEACR